MSPDRVGQAAFLAVAGFISASSVYAQYPGYMPRVVLPPPTWQNPTPVALPQRYDLSLEPTIKTYDVPQIQETAQAQAAAPEATRGALTADESYPTADAETYSEASSPTSEDSDPYEVTPEQEVDDYSGSSYGPSPTARESDPAWGSASTAGEPATTAPAQSAAGPYSVFSDLRLWIVGGVIALIVFCRRR